MPTIFRHFLPSHPSYIVAHSPRGHEKHAPILPACLTSPPNGLPETGNYVWQSGEEINRGIWLDLAWLGVTSSA